MSPETAALLRAVAALTSHAQAHPTDAAGIARLRRARPRDRRRRTPGDAGGAGMSSRVAELCCGAGGMSLGWHRAGFVHVRGVERDPDAAAVARATGIPVVVADASDPACLDGLDHVDVLAGGVPCQAFSSAGKRLGARDERNGFPWVIAAVDRLRARGAGPTWVVLENVPGLAQHRAEAECDDGRRPDPMACPACYLHGEVLPELARRFAVVAGATPE